MDKLPLCEECYDFITNEINNNEKAEEYTDGYYTTVVYPPGTTPPTRPEYQFSLFP